MQKPVPVFTTRTGLLENKPTFSFIFQLENCISIIYLAIRASKSAFSFS